MNTTITENLVRVRRRIENACIAANRNPAEVKLLLATKTVSAERIVTALQAGESLIAENKVQELREKYEILRTIPHVSHFIGHLQTNKIKDVLKYGVSCIQSVDRTDLADKLHHRLQQQHRTIDVLIQVNTSFEASKFGVDPEEAIALVRHVASLETLRVKGLMTIGLFSADAEKIRSCFRLLKNLQQQIDRAAIPRVDMRELSMGMSGDLEIAIEEGATIVRVGTDVFGERATPDSYYWNEGGRS